MSPMMLIIVHMIYAMIWWVEATDDEAPEEIQEFEI